MWNTLIKVNKLPGLKNRLDLVTAINFILPLNSYTECEFEFSKNLKRAEYLCTIYHKLVETEYQLTNRYSNYNKFKWILSYWWKTEIQLFVNSR
jgi:hypothetical protein